MNIRTSVRKVYTFGVVALFEKIVVAKSIFYTKYLIVQIFEIMRNLKLFGDLPAVIIHLPWYFMLYNLYLHLAATVLGFVTNTLSKALLLVSGFSQTYIGSFFKVYLLLTVDEFIEI